MVSTILKKTVNVNDSKFEELQSKFDKKINQVVVLQGKIIEKFPPCDKTEKLLNMIQEAKQYCYNTELMKESNIFYILFYISQLRTKFSKFLPKEFLYKYYKKILIEQNETAKYKLYDDEKMEQVINKDVERGYDNNNAMQLNNEQAEIIENLIDLCNDLCDLYIKMIYHKSKIS